MNITENHKFQLYVLALLVIITNSCTTQSTPASVVNVSDELDESVVITFENDLELESDTTTIDLIYYGLMCPCPQWITPENLQVFKNSVDYGAPIPMDSLFLTIDSFHDSIANPLNQNYDTKDQTFTFTGQFFKYKQKWKSEDGQTWNNRQFKYYKVVEKS